MSLFSQSQDQIFRNITIALNSLSILGTLLIIIIYCTKKKTRTYSFKLVVYMAISNFILAFGYLLCISATTLVSTISCDIQAFLINFGQLSSLIWTTVFAFCLKQCIKQGEYVDLETYEYKFLIAGYLIPLLLSGIPLINMGYSNSLYYFCWINIMDHNPLFLIEQVIQFYFPLLIAIIYNIYVTILIKKFKKQVTSEEQRKDLQYLERLVLYPIVLIVCWSPKLVTITLITLDLNYFWVYIVDAFVGGLLGLAYSIIYGTNKYFIEEVWKDIFSYFYKSKDQNEIQLIISKTHERPRSLQESPSIDKEYINWSKMKDRKYSVTLD